MYKFVYDGNFLRKMGIKLTETELRICKAVILGHLNAFFIGKRAYDMLKFCNYFLKGIDITHATSEKLNEYFAIENEHLLFIRDSNHINTYSDSDSDYFIRKYKAEVSNPYSNTQIIIANDWGQGTREWINERGFVQTLINKSFVVYDTNFEDEIFGNFAKFDINDEKKFKEQIPIYIIRNINRFNTFLSCNYIGENNSLNIIRLARALAEIDSKLTVNDEYYEEAKKYMLVEHY